MLMTWRNRWIKDIKCPTASDVVTWMFLGGEAPEDRHCEDMDECLECWPRCCYCWLSCDPFDGICENDDFMGTSEPCPTTTNWAPIAATRTAGMPPWFHQAYREVSEAADDNPWRPEPLTRWRAPMALTMSDSALYWQNGRNLPWVKTPIDLLMRSWLVRYNMPPVSLRSRFRDARAPWRQEWLDLYRHDSHQRRLPDEAAGE